MKHSFFLFWLATTLAAPAFSATHADPSRKFEFQYDEAAWEIVPEKTKPKEDVDKAMSEKTLVTVQKKAADEKYHPRFSVVVDSLKKFSGTPDAQFKAYKVHALDFLKGQRFNIISQETKTIANLGGAVYEIVANQRDFGLTFRQVVFLRGGEAYLLTATTRTDKFAKLEPETRKFFDTFAFQK